MPFETVTGYCWPQSVVPGGTVGLHLSSPAGRPVAVEVARVGAERTLVFADDAVPADHHHTPPDAHSSGCGWPAAMALDVGPDWRSGYYEVVLEVDVDGKRRRSHALRRDKRRYVQDVLHWDLHQPWVNRDQDEREFPGHALAARGEH